jgi:hypothetical protein
MRPTDREAPIADIQLERDRLGELPADRRREIAARLEADPRLRERLAELDASDAAFASSYPASAMADALRARARVADVTATPRASVSIARPLQAVAAAAAVCLVAVAVFVWPLVRPADDTTVKGGSGPSLVVHRRVGDRSEPLERGAKVREGDQIRIGYRAAGARFGVILSSDGRGALTQHWPRTGDRAAPLEPSGTVLLDFAYELDDAPRWEAFYFVAADAPFEIEPIRRAIRAANGGGAAAPSTLTLPAGQVQFLFPLSKDQR